MAGHVIGIIVFGRKHKGLEATGLGVLTKNRSAGGQPRACISVRNPQSLAPFGREGGLAGRSGGADAVHLSQRSTVIILTSVIT